MDDNFGLPLRRASVALGRNALDLAHAHGRELVVDSQFDGERSQCQTNDQGNVFQG